MEESALEFYYVPLGVRDSILLGVAFCALFGSIAFLIARSIVRAVRDRKRR